MLIEHDRITKAFDWVSFTVEQRRAIELVYQCYVGSPEAQCWAEKDFDILQNPSVPGQLVTSAETLQKLYASLDIVYPVLILLAGIPWLKAQYVSHKIDPDIMADTLSDIPLWMTNCEAKTGRIGMLEYTWLTNHLRFRLFRLGRLEYIYCPSRVPAYAYRHKASGEYCYLIQEGMRLTDEGEVAGKEEKSWTAKMTVLDDAVTGFPIQAMGRVDSSPCTLQLADWELAMHPEAPVLDVHIPEGPPLDFTEVQASLRRAPQFFREKLGIDDMRAFTCGSWLMSPSLAQIAPRSRIAAFQSLFRCVPYTDSDYQVFQRVFGKAFDGWKNMPCHNRLQKGIKDWYLAGGNCRQMQGVIMIPPQKD